MQKHTQTPPRTRWRLARGLFCLSRMWIASRLLDLSVYCGESALKIAPEIVPDKPKR